MCKKYQANTQYPIGTIYFITFSKGYKCPQDYLIHWNGEQQFDDYALFSTLFNNVACPQCAYNFVKHFCYATQFISFDAQCVKTNIVNVGDVINFVNSSLLTDELKLCLASMIFRCDIDNINYECPRFNGCVRHFVQILMVFGYKFNISQWQIPIINNFIQQKIIQNPQYAVDYPQLISDIGYKDDDRRKVNKDISFASVQDFTNMYQRILPQLSRL